MQNLGFSDQHCHGYHGVDFATETDPEAIRRCVAHLKARGTERLTASLPSMPVTDLLAAVERLVPLVNEGVLAGIHLEGPFLSPCHAGAHPAEALLADAGSTDALNFLEALWSLASDNQITAMTYAPELPGAPALERTLIDHGVSPSPGHTHADGPHMRNALVRLRGALPDGELPVITHLFNAMPGFHHRDPGPLPDIISACRAGKCLVELICDGHHLHPDLVRWCFDTFPDAIRVVSDASAATVPSPTASHPTARFGALTLQTTAHGVPTLTDGATLASGAVDLAGAYDNLISWGINRDTAVAACCR